MNDQTVTLCLSGSGALADLASGIPYAIGLVP